MTDLGYFSWWKDLQEPKGLYVKCLRVFYGTVLLFVLLCFIFDNGKSCCICFLYEVVLGIHAITHCGTSMQTFFKSNFVTPCWEFKDLCSPFLQAADIPNHVFLSVNNCCASGSSIFYSFSHMWKTNISSPSGYTVVCFLVSKHLHSK